MGSFVDMMARLLELDIRYRTGRIVNRLQIHSHDKADQRFGGRKELQDVVSLATQLRSIDLDKSHIVSACLQTNIAEFLRVERDRRLIQRSRRPLTKSPDARVLLLHLVRLF